MAPQSTLELLGYHEKITLTPEHPDCEDAATPMLMSKPMNENNGVHIREYVSTAVEGSGNKGTLSQQWEK